MLLFRPDIEINNMMRHRITISLMLAFVFVAVCLAGESDWTHLAGNSARVSITLDGPDTIDSGTLAWVAWEDPSAPGYYADYVGPSCPVVYAGKVYVNAKYYDEAGSFTDNQIICLDAGTGESVWASVIKKGVMDSWASPCVDVDNNAVLIASGDMLYSLDADNGDENWSTELEKNTVNASVCVACDAGAGRAFITDYDGYGITGKLYCINLGDFTQDNQYEPGDIVWSDTIGGASGNTPAYRDGVVYVTSIRSVDHQWTAHNSDPGGSIYAYDANADTAVRSWGLTSNEFDGFFGGLVVTKAGYLYAANYNLYGGQDNSALCKVDCSDGSIVWVTQVERTETVPIVVGDMIYISGGIGGWGARPKVEAYRDLGDSAVKLWETPADMVVGGWTNQPVYANGKLYVGGSSDAGQFSSYNDLYILDVTKTPVDADFVIDQFSGCGSSPAVTLDSVYSLGYDGFHKFYQAALAGDVNGDGTVGELDLTVFLQSWLWAGPVGFDRCDLDLDGRVAMIDFALFAKDWLEDVN